jgi:trehalose 6-phosphate synthase
MGHVASDWQVVVAANRAPVVIHKDGRVTPAPGGLAAALIGVGRRVGAHWVACARTPAERTLATVPTSFRTSLFPGGPANEISYVGVDPAIYALHYQTAANPVLWLVQHEMAAQLPPGYLPSGLERAWGGYRAVNQAVADRLAAVCSRLGQPAVLVQDYQLYLTPVLLKARAPKPAVHHFVHLPWPAPAAWTGLPSHLLEEILHGMLASDAVALQTPADVEHFLATCEAVLDVPVDRPRRMVRQGARDVRIHAHPVVLDVGALRKEAAAPTVAAEVVRLAARRPELLLLRADRADPTKNIVGGFRAYTRLLEEHPQLRRRVEFWAFLQPTRLEIALYRTHLADIEQAADAVNRRFGRPGWRPVWLSIGNHRPSLLAAFQLFDCLLVNPIRDGMNLVAKEGALLNGRDGTLVLSTRAGAYRELREAVLGIDPLDETATACALFRALMLDPRERRRRAQLAAAVVAARDTDSWLADLLTDLDDAARAAGSS